MELMIGRVIKAHGIHGEVVVDVTTDEPDIRYADGATLHGKQGKKEHTLTINHTRPHQGRLLVTFDEIPDRTAAESLRGTQFWAEQLDIDDDEEGFYDHDLEGLTVIHDGAAIGEVTGVMSGPAGTILEVRLESGREALIPFVFDIVPEVDLEAGTCTITPPDGLLEL
ncbi:MAG: ribosome maturation factor RimM [Corynebacterium sp.]|nr:ribosome maturation factor RimM [Corynebacterium sp.]